MTELEFKVDPNYLRDHTIVKDPVRIKITKPDSIFLTGVMGESGRKMIADGAPFIFTKVRADELVKFGIAEYLDNQIKKTKPLEYGQWH